ncbi:hypothetical protein ACFL2Q_18075, partial [Thermodesulfobacteriota bacterium]
GETASRRVNGLSFWLRPEVALCQKTRAQEESPAILARVASGVSVAALGRMNVVKGPPDLSAMNFLFFLVSWPGLPIG